MLKECAELGEVVVFAHTERVPELEQLEPESLCCSSTILLTLSIIEGLLVGLGDER